MLNDALHLLFAGATLLGGCTASHSSSQENLGAQVGNLPGELRADYDVFASNCSKCHDIERALNAPVVDRRHWERYVAKMMRTPGSGISSVEAPHILKFLYWYTDRKAGRNQDPEPESSPTVAAPAVAPALTVPQPIPEAVVAPLPAPTAPSEPGGSETQGESTP